tara:strand:+ start:5471 stop:5689 length:219 start_codon:yes stop_codon:yes gene_type:complete
MRRSRAAEWKLQAACRGEPVQIFYDPGYLELAKSFCDGCPVRRPCHIAARRGNEYGVWAGKVWNILPDEEAA